VFSCCCGIVVVRGIFVAVVLWRFLFRIEVCGYLLENAVFNYKGSSIPLGAGLSSSASCSASVFVLRAIVDLFYCYGEKVGCRKSFLRDAAKDRRKSLPTAFLQSLMSWHQTSMTLINDKIVTYDNCGRDAVFFIHTSCSLLSSVSSLW
jgi:hypothetical protein